MKRTEQANITDQTDLLREFAARLKSEMARKGLTLRELGAKLGKSTSTVGAWTQGKNWPEVETLIALTDILDIPFETLVLGVAPTEWTQAQVDEAAAQYEGEITEASQLARNPYGDYLEFVRRIRADAEALGAGDPQKIIALFDKLLDTWSNSMARTHVPSGKIDASQNPAVAEAHNNARRKLFAKAPAILAEQAKSDEAAKSG